MNEQTKMKKKKALVCIFVSSLYIRNSIYNKKAGSYVKIIKIVVRYFFLIIDYEIFKVTKIMISKRKIKCFSFILTYESEGKYSKSCKNNSSDLGAPNHAFFLYIVKRDLELVIFLLKVQLLIYTKKAN